MVKSAEVVAVIISDVVTKFLQKQDMVKSAEVVAVATNIKFHRGRGSFSWGNIWFEL